MLRQLNFNIIERFNLNEDAKRLNKKSTKKNTRYGINLTKLPVLYSNLLKNRLYARHLVDDDRSLKIVFLLANIENDHKSLKKFYYLPHINKIVNYIDLKYNINVVKWECAFCNNEILIDTAKKNKYTDFLCSECENPKIENVDERIIESFFKFSDYITTKLESDYTLLSNKMIKNKKRH